MMCAGCCSAIQARELHGYLPMIKSRLISNWSTQRFLTVGLDVSLFGCVSNAATYALP